MQQPFANPPPAHPELSRHYLPLPVPNNYQCKYCGKFYSLDKHVVDELIWHTRKEHTSYINKPADYFAERMQNLKPPPKYLRKYEHMNIISDKWLDRLALDGYPIADIARSIFLRLKSSPERFFRESEQRTSKIVASKNAIINFLPRLSLSLLPEQMADIIINKFRVSYEAAKLMIKRYSWSFLPQSYMLEALLDRGVFVRKFEEFDVTTVIFCATERMRDNYEQYGEVVNIEYKFTPLKRARSGKHYNICLFVGQDKNLRPLIFAFALLNGECPLYYKLTIKYFLQAMKNRLPCTFITNQTQAMGQVMQDLRQQCGLRVGHMVNWYYTMKKVKYDMSLEYEGEKFLDNFSAALSSITKFEYDQTMGDIVKSNRIRPEKIQQFNDLAYKTCISKAPPSFIGFGIQQDRVQIVDKAVEDSFPYQNRQGLFFNLAFRLDEQWHHKSYDRHSLVDIRKVLEYKVKELIYLSRNMEKEVFTKLTYLYEKSMSQVTIQHQDTSQCHITVSESSRDGNEDQNFHLNYDIQSSAWRCSCRLIYWSGLPCQHLMKVVRKFKGSISYYINTRWLIRQDLANVPEFEEDLQEVSEPYSNEESEEAGYSREGMLGQMNKAGV